MSLGLDILGKIHFDKFFSSLLYVVYYIVYINMYYVTWLLCGFITLHSICMSNNCYFSMYNPLENTQSILQWIYQSYIYINKISYDTYAIKMTIIKVLKTHNSFCVNIWIRIHQHFTNCTLPFQDNQCKWVILNAVRVVWSVVICL